MLFLKINLWMTQILNWLIPNKSLKESKRIIKLLMFSNYYSTKNGRYKEKSNLSNDWELVIL